MLPRNVTGPVMFQQTPGEHLSGRYKSNFFLVERMSKMSPKCLLSWTLFGSLRLLCEYYSPTYCTGQVGNREKFILVNFLNGKFCRLYSLLGQLFKPAKLI